MQLRERQQMWSGFEHALAQGLELVVAPLLFALVGSFVDRLFGTYPVFAIAFGLFGLSGVAMRAYFAYNAAMEREEEGKPWTRTRK